jgi:hypothetical protein
LITTAESEKPMLNRVGKLNTKIINTIENFVKGFDAISVLPNGVLYVTKGEFYVKYENDEPPRKITAESPIHLASGGWGDGSIKLPAEFAEGFDSMATLPNGKTYVTKGQKYVRYSDEDAMIIDEGYPANLDGGWGNLPAAFQKKFDAMATLPNGKTYVLNGSQYIRYSDKDAMKIDEGYPRAMKGNWGELPSSWYEGVDALGVINRKTYLFKGSEYVRYSDPSANVIDEGYPKPIEGHWGFVESD